MRRTNTEVGQARRRRVCGGDKTEADTKKKFPWALHSLLDDAEKSGKEDIISWRPSGTAFIVHNREAFMKQILPNYFRQSKFKSFVRQLNLWGFTFIDEGPDKGSYYHSKFVRGNPDLCEDMQRQKIKGRSGEAKVSGEIQDSSFHSRTNVPNVPLTSTTTMPIGRNSSNAFFSQTSASVPGNLGFTPGVSTNPHRNFLSTNHSNTHPSFHPMHSSIQPTLERETDWLDRLEAIFCPTDIQIPTATSRTNAQVNFSDLEPRPIRTSNKTSVDFPPKKEKHKRPPLY